MDASCIISAEELNAAIIAPEAVVLQGGRNLTVRTTIRLHDGTLIDAAVKRFPPPSPLRALLNRKRGMPSKAMRSYVAAKHLSEKKPNSTPLPIAIVETGSAEAPGECWFVTRFEPDLISFKRKLVDLYANYGPCPALMDLLRVVAENCARIHDIGFMHCDLGNQNIMLSYPDGTTEPRVILIDLNRSRIVKGSLTTRARARDISRIDLPSDFLRVFIEMYWRGARPPDSFLKAERMFRRRYAFQCATRRIRHPFRPVAPSLDGVYPAPRDLWIWDTKSEQAMTTMRSRDRHRYQSFSRIFAPLLALTQTLVKVERNRRNQTVISFERPLLLFSERAFVSISANPDRLEKELHYLVELGCIGIHIRFYAHDPDAVTLFKIETVRRLKSMNYAVAISLVQNREVVVHPEKWMAFCVLILDSLHDAVMWVEMLHAVNRVKWGIWNFAELRQMLKPLEALSKKFSDVTFIGPSLIDFEWDYLSAALKCLPQKPKLHALSCHLYVDRRGPPEAMQGKFNALGKMQLLRAIAATSPHVHEHLIISEFNWPLQGTREWSPVGSPYVSPGERTNDPSVTEEQAASYIVRYLFIGLCSGLADQMVFWSLASHGFGLIDPGTTPSDVWRERPAFKALKLFFNLLKHAHFTNAIRRGEQDVWAMKFASSTGQYIVAAWSSSPDGAPWIPELPFKVSKALDLYGNTIPIPERLSSEIVYLLQE